MAIGAALAPDLAPSRLLPALAAFFLAVGIGAHALDELNGRPLRTEIPRGALLALAASSIAAAVAIGAVGAARVDPWLGIFVAAGAFMVVTYNLELFGGRFHGDVWFALFWGAFPLLTGYFAVAGTLSAASVLGGLFAFTLSLAQRRLSTQVRDARRRVTSVTGTIERRDGSSQALTREVLTGAAEAALATLAASTVALALALVVMRLA